MEPGFDDFARLRSLLKLKRYEQPPPRYFEDLSQRVLQRLRGPEGLRQSSPLAALGLWGGWKPAFFYGLGAVCCALSLYGVVNLVVQGPAPDLRDPQTASAFEGPKELAPLPAVMVLRPDGQPDDSAGSTNPVLSPGSTGFPIDPYRLRTVPVNFEKRETAAPDR